MRYLLFLLLILAGCAGKQSRIDRFSLVTRHNIVITEPDPVSSLIVGNGEFTFAADVSGLQSFSSNHDQQIGLVITKTDGQQASIADLKKINQQLDLWTGRIQTTYEVEGEPVKVSLYALQDDDGIAARIESPLLSDGRIKATIQFSDPSKIDSAAKYFSIIENTGYFTNISWDNGHLAQTSPLKFELRANDHSTSLDIAAVFSKDRRPAEIEFDEVARYNIGHWRTFWTLGGAIDFSKCTDPRAQELERRVVLAQYFTKIHRDTHWTNLAGFALWNRASIISRVLDNHNLATDRTAQPHLIYLAELMYRNTPDRIILDRYSEMVFETAGVMASTPVDSVTDVAFWKLTLELAQQWRVRLKLPENEEWKKMINHLTSPVNEPTTAITAARSGKPEKAVELLMAETDNYALLTAVAMMAAGWDGSKGANPGFPKNGEWEVIWEGLQQMP